MTDGIGDLTPIHVGSALDRASDPEGAYLVFVERGLAAIEQASTLQEGVNVLGVCQTLAYVARVKGLHDETCIKGSALAVAAERRLGQLIVAEREAGRLVTNRTAGPGRGHLKGVTPEDTFSSTLGDHGITRNRAAEAAKLAGITDERFGDAMTEAAVKIRARGGRNLSSRTILGIVDPEGEKSPDQRWIDADKTFTALLKIGRADLEATLAAIRFGIYPGDMSLVDQAPRIILDAARETLDTLDQELRRKGL